MGISYGNNNFWSAVTDWSNSNSDVSSVEIHQNDGYTSDTEEEEKKRLIDEIRQDGYVQSRSSSSTLPPSSTTSSSSCDFCYVLSTLVLIFRYMSRSIMISSNSSSDQFNFIERLESVNRVFRPA